MENFLAEFCTYHRQKTLPLFDEGTFSSPGCLKMLDVDRKHSHPAVTGSEMALRIWFIKGNSSSEFSGKTNGKIFVLV